MLKPKFELDDIVCRKYYVELCVDEEGPIESQRAVITDIHINKTSIKYTLTFLKSEASVTLDEGALIPYSDVKAFIKQYLSKKLEMYGISAA